MTARSRPLGSILEAIGQTPLVRLNRATRGMLLSRETRAALVRKDGRLSGIVTRYDVLRQVAGIR